jgi:signal transduction histidine kinase
MSQSARRGYAWPVSRAERLEVDVRFRTWLVAAIGLGSLLIWIVVSMLTLSGMAQDIYTELDQLNMHHNNVDVKLRRLRSDVNLSGIFVRDYLLDVARDHTPEYRERLAEFRRTNLATASELRQLDATHATRIASLVAQLDEYWLTFEPLFDWTSAQKIFRSARFLRQEVVPRREAILDIARDIEELNNATLAAQRAEVARQQNAFRADLHWLLWPTVLLGIAVAMTAVIRLRLLEKRSEAQRSIAEEAERQTRLLSQRLVAAQEDEPKNLSRELHDHLGLQPALEWHVRDVIEQYNVGVELTVSGDLDVLPDRYRTCAYLAIQEALTNCVRHAHAECIQVLVTGRENRLGVSVSDDGIGFEPERRDDGLGLRGIEERVKELNGAMTVSSIPGAGTTLSIHLPLPVAERESRLARAAG